MRDFWRRGRCFEQEGRHVSQNQEFHLLRKQVVQVSVLLLPVYKKSYYLVCKLMAVLLLLITLLVENNLFLENFHALVLNIVLCESFYEAARSNF